MNETGYRQTRALGVDAVLDALDASLRAGEATDLTPVPTGFGILDETVGGGLHPGDLMVLGGPPGVGKTIASLQMARHVSMTGGRALFVCYEHEESVLATRLLALETANDGDDSSLTRVPSMLLEGARARQGLEEAVAAVPAVGAALQRLRTYADRLTLVRASGAHTGLPEIEALVRDMGTSDSPPVVLVDYLQKIPVHPEPPTEAEKVTRTVEALKDLALLHHLPVVLISAVGRSGLEEPRVRLHHLRGSSAVAFEADVVIMLNDKHRAVSKVHLSYDSVGAQRFRDWVVWSIEKNRGGPTLVDMEFQKDFAHFRFDPEGGFVSERLADDRVDDASL